MTYLAIDFHQLLHAVVEKVKEYKVYKTLKRDKHTVKRWLKGGIPEEPRDIAALIRLALHNGIDVTRYQTFKPIYDISPESSYSQNLFSGPPELNWLWEGQDPMPSFGVRIGDLRFDSPIGIGSGPLTADNRYNSAMLDLGFEGPCSLKTRRSGQKGAWEPPQIAFVIQPPDLLNISNGKPPVVLVSFRYNDVRGGVPDLVNSIGVPSEAPAVWQKEYEAIKQHPRGKCVGLSVIGEDTPQKPIKRDFQEAIARALEVAPPFIELNISCPNLKGRDIFSDPEMLRAICSSAKSQIAGKSLLFLKLPCVPRQLTQSILSACGGFLDAVVARNTFKVRPMQQDRDGRQIPAFSGREFGGLSGPSTLPATLRATRDLAAIRQKLGQHFSIIAMGGVQRADDVVALLNSGAAAVQAVTAPIFDPLLALKVRYQISGLQRQKAETREMVAAAGSSLMAPRNRFERLCLIAALQAANEVEQKTSDFPVSELSAKWNPWHESQSDRQGIAQRDIGNRTIDWIRKFTA
jgi:dihydroorotate dehydrogenase (NAD+) catalytic subunit